MTVPYPIAEGVTYGHLSPAALAPVSGLTFDGTSGFFVNTVAADGGPTPVQFGVPLPAIQAVSAPSADAGIFANGVGYVFVLVGDPGQPTFNIARRAQTPGPFNLFSAHILGVPDEPAVR